MIGNSRKVCFLFIYGEKEQINDLSEREARIVEAGLQLEQRRLSAGEIYRDEHPGFLRNYYSNEPEETKKLKRELEREALTRLEDAARTEADYQEVVKIWDRLDRNRERKERYHEIPRWQVPLEYNRAEGGSVFPLWLSDPAVQRVQSGDFLEVLFDCPHLMHENLTDDVLYKLAGKLKDDHKLALYFLALRQYNYVRLAAMQGKRIATSARFAAQSGESSSGKCIGNSSSENKRTFPSRTSNGISCGNTKRDRRQSSRCTIHSQTHNPRG